MKKKKVIKTKKEFLGFNNGWIQRDKPQKKCDRCKKPLTKLFYGLQDTFPGNEEAIICEECGISFHKWWESEIKSSK
jgi:hypothetical protein